MLPPQSLSGWDDRSGPPHPAVPGFIAWSGQASVARPVRRRTDLLPPVFLHVQPRGLRALRASNPMVFLPRSPRPEALPVLQKPVSLALPWGGFPQLSDWPRCPGPLDPPLPGAWPSQHHRGERPLPPSPRAPGLILLTTADRRRIPQWLEDEQVDESTKASAPPGDLRPALAASQERAIHSAV